MTVDGISIDPDIMGGSPCIAGTRIPVFVILEKLEAGYTFDRIVEAYPHLVIDQIKAAVRFAIGEVSVTITSDLGSILEKLDKINAELWDYLDSHPELNGELPSPLWRQDPLAELIITNGKFSGMIELDDLVIGDDDASGVYEKG